MKLKGHKLVFILSLIFLVLILSSSSLWISAKATGNGPPQSPPSAPLDIPLYQSNYNELCRVDSCNGACSMEVLALGSLAQFDVYVEEISNLTNCDQGELGAAFDVAFDVASDLASIDTGAYLSCGNVWAGEAYVCNPHCEDNPCLYAPNLRVSITSTDPSIDQEVWITLNNGVSGDGLDATAITGGIDLIASIQYTGWEDAIPFAWYKLPSLGYPGLGWSTNAAAGCLDDSTRCHFLNTLANAGLSKDIAISLPQGGSI